MKFMLPSWALPPAAILNILLIIWVLVLLALLMPLAGPLLALILLYHKRYEPARRLQP
ncbi:MAG: hypothetical protein ICV81_17170 [Flavisolibacter sp.]|nr:hypothetical protein [Flavisolibacter sp.]